MAVSNLVGSSVDAHFNKRMIPNIGGSVSPRMCRTQDIIRDVTNLEGANGRMVN